MLAMLGDQVVGVCLYSVTRGATRSDGYLDLVAVRPTHQGHGVGRRLLTHAEDAFAVLGCRSVTVAGNPPCYAWPGVDARYLAAVCLFEESGYRRAGVELNLRVSLADEPYGGVDALDRHGIGIREATVADADWILASLAGRWKASWLDEIECALRFTGGSLQIAVREDQCVGFCAYGINRPHEIGPLGTDPSVRRLGVGSVLLRRCLADQRRQGLPAAELQWAGPLAWFSRAVGASTSRVFLTYQKDL